MEIHWGLSGSYREGRNTYILSMGARHYIEVQGKKQLFHYRSESTNPENIPHQVEFFTELAREFFTKIEGALTS